MNEFLEEYRALLTEIRRLTSWETTWGWDSALRAALLVVKAEHAEPVLKLLRDRFETAWDSSNVKEAPGHVQYIVEHLAGMRDRQELFTNATNDDDHVLFSGFWPWVKMPLVSVRIGVVRTDNTPVDADLGSRIVSVTLQSNQDT